MQELKVNIENNNGNPVSIYELTGKLPEPINMQPVSAQGNYLAVEDWIKSRTELIDRATANILIDTGNHSIVLVINEAHPHKHTVTATMKINPVLDEFGINTDSRFSHTDLKSMLKLHPHLFVDNTQHSKFLTQLANFKAKIDSDIEHIKTDKGAEKASVSRKVLDMDMTESFNMKAPIFQGGEPKQFKVDVCWETSGVGVQFYLESSELILTFEQTILDELVRQKNLFIEQGFTVVTK